MGEGTFESAMARAPEPMQKIARALRRLLADVTPRIVEVPWVRQGSAGYGVGPRKMSELFCYIAPASRHVNLGFFYGADLADPTRILTGAGKALRHVKVRSVDDVQSPELRRLVERASVHLPKLSPPDVAVPSAAATAARDRRPRATADEATRARSADSGTTRRRSRGPHPTKRGVRP